MASNEQYVCVQMLNLDNHLYRVGEIVPASAFLPESLAPETPEQVIARLVAAGVMQPTNVDATRLDPQMLILQGQVQQKQDQIDAMRAEIERLQNLQPILPASVEQRQGAASKTPDMAPATEEAPLSE